MTQKVIRCQLVAFVQSRECYSGRNREVLRRILITAICMTASVSAAFNGFSQSEFIGIDLFGQERKTKWDSFSFFFFSFFVSGSTICPLLENSQIFVWRSNMLFSDAEARRRCAINKKSIELQFGQGQKSKSQKLQVYEQRRIPVFSNCDL